MSDPIKYGPQGQSAAAGVRLRRVLALLLALLVAACSPSEPPVSQIAETESVVEETEAEATEDPTEEATEDPTEQPERTEDPEPTEDPTEEPTEEPGPGEAVLAYMDVAAGVVRPGDQTLAAPGSPAEVYAAVQVAQRDAQAASGLPAAPADVRVTDEGVDLCDGTECTSYTEFQADGSQVVTFLIDDQPIEPRLSAGGLVAEASGLTGTLIGAYESVSGSLLVSIGVANNSDQPINLNVFSWEYVTAEGVQVASTNGAGPVELRGGATSTVLGVFDQQPVGGTVYLSASTSEFQPIELEFQIPASFE